MEASLTLKAGGKRNTIGVTGHTDNIMSQMREYFEKRPLEILMNAFRTHDSDGSGALDLP